MLYGEEYDDSWWRDINQLAIGYWITNWHVQYNHGHSSCLHHKYLILSNSEHKSMSNQFHQFISIFIYFFIIWIFRPKSENNTFCYVENKNNQKSFTIKFLRRIVDVFFFLHFRMFGMNQFMCKYQRKEIEKTSLHTPKKKCLQNELQINI